MTANKGINPHTWWHRWR